jgi:hypothetical protein
VRAIGLEGRGVIAFDRKRAGVLLLVGLLVLLAGCTAPQATDESLAGTLGEVDGITHNETLSISASDGFSENELQRLVKRTMARIEYIRGQEFERMVDVEIISRSEYQDRRSGGRWEGTAAQWQNQVWEGLFVVGEDRNVSAVFDETFGASVQGYYLIGQDQIVIVSDSETPTISKRTLVHELVHALQDQQFGLDDRPATHDGQMARNGLVEGEASLVPRLYLDRCGAEWSCVQPPDASGSGGSIDPGLFSVVIYPYQQGPTFVETIREQGGWEAVDDSHDRLPVSTEQVIHPDRYPEEKPVDVGVPDRSGGNWSRLDHDPVGERLGEAALFAMLETNDVIDSEQPRLYRHPATAGWGGDRLVPYRHEDGEFGYVWNLTWDTRQDARQFYDAYLALLDSRGAAERGGNRYVVADDAFGDAFRVVLDGRTVRIVNGPTLDSLSSIHRADS